MKLYVAGRLGPYVAYLQGASGESNLVDANGEQPNEATPSSTCDQTVRVSPGKSPELPSEPQAVMQPGSSAPSSLRIETPGFHYKLLPPLFPGHRACAWVLDVHITNPSRTLPLGIRNMRLEVIREDVTHSFPHLGNSTYGSSGEVPFAGTGLPLAVRIDPVTTISGKPRFYEWDGFTEGRVRLDLALEESDGQVHRYTVSEFFDIPQV